MTLLKGILKFYKDESPEAQEERTAQGYNTDLFVDIDGAEYPISEDLSTTLSWVAIRAFNDQRLFVGGDVSSKEIFVSLSLNQNDVVSHISEDTKRIPPQHSDRNEAPNEPGL